MQKSNQMKGLCGIILLSLLAVQVSIQVSAQPPKSSLLWEISGNGLQSPSYLFGTFHIMCKDEFQVSAVLQEKISSSKQFYGEIDMTDLAAQMQMGRKMMMTDKTLSSLLPATDLTKISERFEQVTGTPFKLFNNFKPFMALSLVVLNSFDCTDKVQPETEFVALAKKNNLPVLGLETIDDQINTINSQPIDSQVNDLRKILLNFDSTKQVMKQLKLVYQTRDIDSIYSFMKSGADMNFENELVTKRNRNWIPIIEKAVAAKPSFFAVGAGHLGGAEGVIALLRSRGYQLTPVLY